MTKFIQVVLFAATFAIIGQVCESAEILRLELRWSWNLWILEKRPLKTLAKTEKMLRVEAGFAQTTITTSVPTFV